MLLTFDPSLAVGYSSKAQQARRLTEGWLGTQMYCPRCGCAGLDQHSNNTRATDFFCSSCAAQFELKSHRRRFGHTVPDGAYAAMCARLRQPDGGPDLLLLHYCPKALSVVDLDVVPSRFLTREMVVPRPPLRPTARRAGWVGCNIRIGDVTPGGRIAVVRDGLCLPRPDVLRAMTRSLAIQGSLATRTWLVDTLRCIERLPNEFSLRDVYGFEAELRERHPENHHVRDKLRQQLQRLRDAGFIAFLGRGRYRRAKL